MITNKKCLEITSLQDPWGKRIDMTIHRKKGIIDLYPFFSDLFYERDRFWGDPTKLYSEIADSNTAEYSFSLAEFGETFLGHYPFKDLTNFLEEHLFDGEFEEDFIQRVKGISKNYKIADIGICCGYSRKYWCFKPQNFSVEEMNTLIENSFSSKEISRQKKIYDVKFAKYRKELEDTPLNLISYPITLRKDNPFEKLHSLKKRILEINPKMIFLGKYEGYQIPKKLVYFN